MKIKKEVLVLFVYHGAAEIDWLLPVLDKLSNKYLVFTYFKSKKSYLSLSENKELFRLWKNICANFFIESRFNNFFWKFIRKIFFFILGSHNRFSNNLDSKIHNIFFLQKKVYSKLKKIDFDIKIVFSEFGLYSGWVGIISQLKQRPFLVHYPSTPMLGEYRKFKIKEKYKLRGDMLLLNTKRDLCNWGNYISKKRINVVGIPRHDTFWKKKITNSENFDFDYNKLIKKNYFITICYNSYFDHFKNNKEKFTVLENDLHLIMKNLLSIPNLFIIFKLHPRIKSPYIYKILESYNKHRWHVSSNHIFKLASVSDCFLCHPLSAVLIDSISYKVPTIQMWPTPGLDFDVDKSILGVKAKNIDDLMRLVKLSLFSKKYSLWKRQQKEFNKIYSFLDFSTQKAVEAIDKQYKLFIKTK